MTSPQIPLNILDFNSVTAEHNNATHEGFLPSLGFVFSRGFVYQKCFCWLANEIYCAKYSEQLESL